MAELKTKPTKKSVAEFLDSVKDEQVRADCKKISQIMKAATSSNPKMWGTSIVGFGDYHYKYASGREGDWFLTGFSPRAKNITLYIMAGFDNYDDLMKNLGKHTTGKSCLYIKKLEDIDQKVLEKLIKESVRWMKKSQT